MEHKPPQLFKLRPLSIVAFQWLPDAEDSTLPKWFADMIENGRAYTVQNDKENFVRLSNKRGDYKGLPGDWICKDGFGHIFITSQKTFHQRYDYETKGVSHE